MSQCLRKIHRSLAFATVIQFYYCWSSCWPSRPLGAMEGARNFNIFFCDESGGVFSENIGSFCVCFGISTHTWTFAEFFIGSLAVFLFACTAAVFPRGKFSTFFILFVDFQRPINTFFINFMAEKHILGPLIISGKISRKINLYTLRWRNTFGISIDPR